MRGKGVYDQILPKFKKLADERGQTNYYAVSYTHLDVYKRQLLAPSASGRDTEYKPLAPTTLVLAFPSSK